MPSSDLCFKLDEMSSYSKVEGKKLMDREQSEMMELVIWSTGDVYPSVMVRREICLRKKQNGVQVREESRWQSSRQLHGVS